MKVVSCAADKPFYFLCPRAPHFTVFSPLLLTVVAIAQLDLGADSVSGWLEFG